MHYWNYWIRRIFIFRWDKVFKREPYKWRAEWEMRSRPLKNRKEKTVRVYFVRDLNHGRMAERRRCHEAAVRINERINNGEYCGYVHH